MGEKRRRLTKIEILDDILFNMDEIKLFKNRINNESNRSNFYERMIEQIKDANLYLCSMYRFCN